MNDQWTDRLSEYVDGELGAGECGALEAHLGSCAACRDTVAELRRVVARARSLEDRPPAADLWPGIAARIGLAAPVSVRRGRRVSFTWPALAAAAVALVLVSAAATRLLLQPGLAPWAGASGWPRALPATFPLDRRYSRQVEELERTLERDRGRLDTATVRVIEQNLAIIDRAIRDAQGALAADPANSYLNLHLAAEMRLKLQLLRQAAALATARS